MKRLLVVLTLVLTMVMMIPIATPALAVGMSAPSFGQNVNVYQGEMVYYPKMSFTVFTSGTTTLNCVVTTETPSGITIDITPTTCTVSVGHPCKLTINSISVSDSVVAGKYRVYIVVTEQVIKEGGGIRNVAAIRFSAYVTVLQR